MKRDNLPWSQAPSPTLRWSEHGAPISEAFDDYYCQDDGLKESRHVFLAGNDLPQRWQNHPRSSFCIFESGFGTGLNFLATWQAWQAQPKPRPRLHYIATENNPLRLADLRKALSNWPELAQIGAELVQHYPSAVPGQHRLVFEHGNILLDLWWLDVADTLNDLAGHKQSLVDAWYLDGFSPARNAAMWSWDVLSLMPPLSRAGATFGTFTAAGQVRRDLMDAGFAVEKRAGFGLKRECMYGHLTALPKPDAHYDMTPWDLTESFAQPKLTHPKLPNPKLPNPQLPHAKQPQSEPSQSAIVIGAGLAGCFTAAALARRGVAVTVVESGDVAGAASGNLQGVLYTRLSRRHSALTDFALISFLYAARCYKQMFESLQLSPRIDGSLCGAFQQMSDTEEMAIMAEALAQSPELAQVLDPVAASSVLGVTQQSAGYWFPNSGWLNPQAVCRALLQTPGITLLENCGDVALSRATDHWQVSTGNTTLASAASAVIAAGASTTDFEASHWLPIRGIRGQTTQLPADTVLNELSAVLCHHGYIAPGTTQGHCIGASFDVDDPDTALRSSDHQKNLSALAAAVPHWASTLSALEPDKLTGRVGWRCASPDYLPMVGPAPDLESFKNVYADLRRNAQQVMPIKGPCLPGLYLNTGHGSKGLSSTPLAAELLASQICDEAPPLERTLCRALAPARFIMRDLARNRI